MISEQRLIHSEINGDHTAVNEIVNDILSLMGKNLKYTIEVKQ
jgi:hypothetical protein